VGQTVVCVVKIHNRIHGTLAESGRWHLTANEEHPKRVSKVQILHVPLYMPIREAKIEDVEVLYNEIYLKQTNLGHEHEPAKYLIEDFKHATIDNRTIFLVYEDDKNNLCGFAMAYDFKTWIYLDVLCVGKPFRNSGLGKELISYLRSLNDYVIGCYYTEDILLRKFLENNDCTFWSKNTTWFKL